MVKRDYFFQDSSRRGRPKAITYVTDAFNAGADKRGQACTSTEGFGAGAILNGLIRVLRCFEYEILTKIYPHRWILHACFNGS